MFFLNTFTKLVILIHEHLDNEINDAQKLQQQLFEASLKYEMDEITESEYEEIKNYIVQRMHQIKQRKLAEAEE